MKNLKKLFLISTLLTFSGANFLGAMEEQAPIKKPLPPLPDKSLQTKPTPHHKPLPTRPQNREQGSSLETPTSETTQLQLPQTTKKEGLTASFKKTVGSVFSRPRKGSTSLNQPFQFERKTSSSDDQTKHLKLFLKKDFSPAEFRAEFGEEDAFIYSLLGDPNKLAQINTILKKNLEENKKIDIVKLWICASSFDNTLIDGTIILKNLAPILADHYCSSNFFNNTQNDYFANFPQKEIFVESVVEAYNLPKEYKNLNIEQLILINKLQICLNKKEKITLNPMWKKVFDNLNQEYKDKFKEVAIFVSTPIK